MDYIRLWIDSLDFDDFGGWKPDTQHGHLMGSAYLLACDRPGVPVADASAHFSVPYKGRFRIWARTRNWYYPYSPGLFTLRVDDRESGIILGNAPSNDWLWQIGGDFELDKGSHRLFLKDLSGYFGRCSSILITDDMDYLPKRLVGDFERERALLKGLSLEPVDEGEYDVIVAGAGPGGVPAALAAARLGARTLIISNRPVLGGNSSTEAGVGFNGASARQPNARDSGIVEEIIRLKGYKGCTWTQALTELCEKEELLTVCCNLHVNACRVVDNRIQSITARHTINGTYHLYTGKMFIDSTGDSWMAFHAGARHRLGREAKWQHQEEFAPLKPDLNTMSGCIMGNVFENTGKPVSYTPPPWAPVFPKGKAFGRNIERIGQVWWNEHSNELDDLYDAELARDELFRVMLGYFNYLKNLWDEKEKAAPYIFRKMAYIDAKRESRRMMGDYILTQEDCLEGKDFPDTVVHAGWPIDLHHPKGIYSGEEGPFFSNCHVPLVKIPFRCLYSRNIDNLLAAGRNISVTHIALGTARLQGTIGAVGQAAGTAAFLCVKENLTPRQLYHSRIKQLQQLLLRFDQYIPGVRNEDPLDLARGAAVTASSVEAGEAYINRLGIEGDLLPLDRWRAAFFARGVSKTLQSIYLKIDNTADHELPLTLHVREQADPDGYTSTEDIAVVTSIIPAKGEHWVEFPVNVTTELRYLWVFAPPHKDLSWRMVKYPPLDWTRSERTCETDKFENIRGETHCLTLEKPLFELADCGAANVINGFSRANSAREYCWVSDKSKKLPQWIMLELREQQVLSEIHLTFDSDMTNPAMLHPIPKIPGPLVTEYTVELFSGDERKTHIEVKDNYLRKKVHTFPEVPCDRVRVNVINSGDGRTARIFEIRLYGKACC